MKLDTLRQLQLTELGILKKMHNICIKNDLKYYIIGGTLLGAVRHKGFIPWDDDIDIVMYREDYNKLISIVQKEYSDIFFIQTSYTDISYTRYVAKIRLKGTTLIESEYKNNKSQNGVYIDIFPLDYVQKTNSLDLMLRGFLIRYLFAYKSIRYDGLGNKGFKTILGKILKTFTYLIPNTYINKLFEYCCQKDNKKNCPYTTNFLSHFKWEKQLFENNVYSDGVLLPFEDTEFFAPKNYDFILKRLYGDKYMELPPEEKRESHNIIKLDLGKYENGCKL